ncbi:MAG: 4Fe-4S dicluster domain-containing protein [Eggerthellaceae bacterium]|nr:4Fe-4S dicluster domain-containing protein [Eggerthellaceae bacterium]
MGSKFVMSDPGLCIGCKTCMAACLTKHDVTGDVAKARLNLVTTLSVSTPIVCHHCEAAPCASVCPTHALYRDGNRVAVRAENCIGCRSCVMACPYGAVDVVVSDLTARLGNLAIKGVSHAAVIKCDLCVDRANGPACVAACPTSSLRLVDSDDIEAEALRRRREAAADKAAFSSIPLTVAAPAAATA